MEDADALAIRNQFCIFLKQCFGYFSVYIRIIVLVVEKFEIFFKFLDGGMVTITAEYPAGRIGTTTENLLEAAEGEKLEWSTLYYDFEQTAIDEGFKDVAAAFKKIAEVESFHEWRYRRMLQRLEEGTMFMRDEAIVWQCRNCGYIHEDVKPPLVCPACLVERAYFEPKRNNY